MKRLHFGGLLALFLMVLLAACVPPTLPPIVIVPAPPPVVTPAPPQVNRATLAVILTDAATGAPLVDQWVTVERVFAQRTGTPPAPIDGGTNQDGYIAFDAIEQGDYMVTAGDHSSGRYAVDTVRVRLTENRNVRMALRPIPPPSAPPAPPQPAPPVVVPPPVVTPPAPPVVAPAPISGMAECGAAENTGRVSQRCIDAVAATSLYSKACRITGEAAPCHYLVREIASALATTQSDPRWGLIKKTQGGENFEGYGVDVVAYLPSPLSLTEPTYRWNGADIIGGLGEPNARLNGGALHRVLSCDTATKEEIDAEGWCNRTSDVWAPVPVSR